MSKIKIVNLANYLLPVALLWLGFVLVCFAIFINKNIGDKHLATGINQQINYQGRLLTGSGAVVPDGSYNIEFKIYQDGDGVLGGGDETLEWTESRTGGNRVLVKNGYFSVYLGSITPFGSNVEWNQDTLWLSVNIGGTGSPSWDGEMSPFTRFSSTPYALNSKALNGLESSNFVQLAQGTQTDASTTNASISINKTGGTANILDLMRGGTSVLSIANNGSTIFKNQANSTTAFQVQNTNSDQLLNIDTSTTLNLLTNGNFESGTTGWAAKGGASISQTTSEHYLGNGSMQVDTTTAAGDGAQYTQSLASQTQYTITFYAKLDSSSTALSSLSVGRTEDGSTDSDCATGKTINNRGWVKVTCAFTTGNVTGTNNIYIKQADAPVSGRTMYIDSFELQTSTNLISNPDLETDVTGWSSYNGAYLSQTASQAYTGSSSAQIDTNTFGGQQGALISYTPTANITYKASFWVQLDSGNPGNATFSIYKTSDIADGVGAVCPNSSQSLTPGVWTQLTCTFTSTDGQGYSPFVAVATNDPGDFFTYVTFYVDNASMSVTKYNSNDIGRISLNGAINSPLILQGEDSTAALQVQQKNGLNIFTVDTLTGGVGIGTDAPTRTLQVNGKSLFVATAVDTDTLKVVGTHTYAALTVGANALSVTIGDLSIPSPINANLTVYGNGTIQSRTNTTATFRVQNASSVTVFGVDTTNSKLLSGIADGASAVGFNLNTTNTYSTSGAKLLSVSNNGTEKFSVDKDGSIDIASGAAYKIDGTDICTASGCTPASGSSNYIQNGTSPQTADFNITGTGTIGSGLTVDSGGATITAGNLALTAGALTTGGTQRLSNSGTLSNITGYAQSSGNFTNNSTGIFNTSTGNVNLRGDTTVSSDKTFTANGSVLFQNATDSTAAFQIQDLAGTSNLLVADTTTNRIAIGQATANYKLDVAGDINTSTGYRVAGTAGATTTCSGGQFLQNQVATGGLTMSGTCANAVTTVGSLGGSIANGASISGNTITLGSADTSNPGLVTTGAQTFGGYKTFDGGARVNNSGLLVRNLASDGFRVQTTFSVNLLNVDTSSNIITIGASATDGLVLNSEIRGSSPLTFEGATNDNVRTTFSITDPTVARTITFPDATGYVVLDTQFNGDATVSSSGLVTIQSGVVSNSKLANSSINLALGTSGTDINWGASSVSLGGTATLNLPDATASARGLVTAGAQTFGGNKTFSGTSTIIKPGSNNLYALRVQDNSGYDVINVSTYTNNKKLSIGDGANVDGLFGVYGSNGNGFEVLTNGGGSLSAGLDTYDFYDSTYTTSLFSADASTGYFGVGIYAGGASYPLDVAGDINTSTGYRVAGTAGASTTCSGGQFLQNLVATGGLTTGGTCANAVTTVGTLGGSIANGASISGNTLTLGTADGSNPGLVTTGAQTFAGVKTFNSAIAANGGITFDNATDTLSAFTLAGTQDAGNNSIVNIGNAGTDFTSGGGLTLAGALTANSGASIQPASAGSVGLTITGGTNQTADLMRIVDEWGDNLLTVNPNVGFAVKSSDGFTSSNAFSVVKVDSGETIIIGVNSATPGLYTESSSFNLINTAATTLNIGGAVGAGGINFAGGYGSTGCSIDGSNGNLSCNGSLTLGAGLSATTGTFSGAIAANGGITFDNSTDTLGAFTNAGTQDANNNLILNIGNAGTDFTSGGGLTLAGAFIANGTVTTNGVMNFGDGGDALTINSSAFDVSSAGALSGITTVTASGNISTTGVYVQNGNTGVSISCGSNNYLSNIQLDGGIITGNNGCRGIGFSDARLKDNVVSLESGTLDKIKNIRTIHFDFKCDSDLFTEHNIVCEEGQQTGVIAQELQQIFPELVYIGEEGYYKVKYDALAVYNLKAVSEIAQFIDSNGNANFSTVKTDELTAEKIKTASNNGLLIEGDLEIDGNLIVKGIKAENIEGMQVLTNRIGKLESGAQPQENQSIFSSITTDSLTVKLDLGVEGSVDIGSGLTVAGLATFEGETIFNKFVRFGDQVIFSKEVSFEDRVSFGGDNGGFAVIDEGQKEIRVNFNRPFQNNPVVNLSIKNGQFADHAYKDLDKEGFTIVLKDSAITQIEFSWTAFEVKDARTITRAEDEPNE